MKHLQKILLLVFFIAVAMPVIAQSGTTIKRKVATRSTQTLPRTLKKQTATQRVPVTRTVPNHTKYGATAKEKYTETTVKQVETNACETVEQDTLAVVKQNEDRVYDVVEEQPKFDGNVNRWLAENLKYPEEAVKNDIEGRVIVQFVVCKDGSISNVTVVRGVDSSLDAEAIRVVQAMPNWIPGRQNGEVVNCKYTLPIIFKLS